MSSNKIHDIGQIIQRLKLAENFRTDKEVAAFLGVSGQALSLWLKRNSQSPVEKILYRMKGKIRERWLLTGENIRYPIRDMTGIDFRIVGVVVEKRKRY